MKYILSLILFGVSIVLSQDIPLSVKKKLDANFHDWKLRPEHVNNPCDTLGPLQAGYKTFYRCNLNGDSITDFAIAILAKKNSIIDEYYLALVSLNSSLELFVLNKTTNGKGVGERIMYVPDAGAKMPYYGSSDSEIIESYGKVGSGDDNSIEFPVAIVVLEPLCEKTWKVVESPGYVFYKNRFIDFGTAD